MSKEILLGIDIGTSGCKVAAFDLDGGVVATSSQSYETRYPGPQYVEQDAMDWWRAACRCLEDMRGQGLDVERIAAIGIDGTSWACLPVDAQGTPLRPAMIWMDRRAEPQAKWMRETIGEDKLIALSGNPVDAAYITPKMLWLKANEPEIYAHTRYFLQCNAFIAMQLTGMPSQDLSQGYGFHFFDIAKLKYDEAMLAALQLDAEKLAPIVPCHQIVGGVTEQAARETGLCAGTPVVAGGLDAACCSLGAGVIRPWQTQEQGGQAGGMSILTDRPLIHPQLILGCHVLPGGWLLQGGSVGGGGTMRWFSQQLAAAEQGEAKAQGKSVFEVLSDEAGAIPAGSEGLIFLPYMAGERSPIWDSDARGVFFGLSYDKGRAHMVRAMMEGVAYSLHHNIQTAAQVGAQVETMVSVGGSANSRVWTQIKSDVTGKRIEVPYSDHATPLGAAILAGVGCGAYAGFDEAVQRCVRIQRVHEPDGQTHDRYGQYFEIYQGLYPKLKDDFAKLAQAAR
ncbi:xylulokinase [Luoshenia tenuis]|uniref:xylulokinase n=1 Tax=Luoshenia tenuis TaxID=2763654 RepID=UPI003D937F95